MESTREQIPVGSMYHGIFRLTIGRDLDRDPVFKSTIQDSANKDPIK